jgi:hypothetical protein
MHLCHILRVRARMKKLKRRRKMTPLMMTKRSQRRRERKIVKRRLVLQLVTILSKRLRKLKVKLI